MIELKLISLLSQGIPECVAMAALVWALIGRSFDWKKMVAVGVLQGFTLYLIRLLPITFGIHAYIGIFTLAIYSYLLTKGNLLRTIISSIIAFLVLATLENLFQRPILMILDLSWEQASQKKLLWILMGWPQVIGLFITALIVNNYNLRKGRAVDG